MVLGGDTPLAGPLIHSLESSGFIVIVTVADSDAVAELESRYHGYVRALVLDPKEVNNLFILFLLAEIYC